MPLTYIILVALAVNSVGAQTLTNATRGLDVQVFDNVAEISQPISVYDLPKIYSQEQWSDVRSDSFRLIGDYVNVQAQVISFTRPSLNGQKILIQRSSNNDTYTDAIMVDETRSLIQDLIDNTFYMINSDRIRYLSVPAMRSYSVDFIFETNSPEQLYLRYLQNNLKWKVRYDLILENNDKDSFLQAYADIRNDGSSSLMIDTAQLISGDVNIRSYSSASDYQGGSTTTMAFDNGAFNKPMASFAGAPPMISSGAELAGVYIFSINETFVLDAQSSMILPMFRPTIDIERYGLIEKSFARMNNRGNAKRGYRLRVPESYLPKGHVFIRESNRLVGETTWSDHAANETNEFHLGEDPDLQYSEHVQMNSRRQAFEENGYRLILSTYTIQLRVLNTRKRPTHFEYRLRFPSQENLSLKENTANNLLQLDGATITGMIQSSGEDEQQIQFTVETQ